MRYVESERKVASCRCRRLLCNRCSVTPTLDPSDGFGDLRQPRSGYTLPGELRWMLVALAGWALWALASSALVGASFSAMLPFLSFPLALAAGVGVGGLLTRSTAGPALPAILAVAAGLVAIAIPFYANAQAAWGLQLLALAGLFVVKALTGEDHRLTSRGTVFALGMLGLMSVLLISRAQATSALVVPLGVIILCAVLWRPVLSRAVVAISGLVVVATAALVLITLASLSKWPEALNAGSSLSSTRHRLWADALQLWRENPLIGAGPGAFFAHSDIARSNPLLERAHSAILQAGAELGSVGAILFLLILAAGAALAARGTSSAGLIAVAAWSALAVHSMIDHLYEFPIVVLTAGIVIGYASDFSPWDLKKSTAEPRRTPGGGQRWSR